MPDSTTSPTRRRYGWWIAAVLLIASAGAAYFLAEPALGTWSVMRGNPQLPGCTTTTLADSRIGEDRYRIASQVCESGLTMYHVFLFKQDGFFAAPIAMIENAPQPRDVRKQGDGYDVLFADALADGRTSLHAKVDANGFPDAIHHVRNRRIVEGAIQ